MSRLPITRRDSLTLEKALQYLEAHPMPDVTENTIALIRATHASFLAALEVLAVCRPYVAKEARGVGSTRSVSRAKKDLARIDVLLQRYSLVREAIQDEEENTTAPDGENSGVL